MLFYLVDEKDEADLWLLNSCTVKNPAEDHFKNSIKEARSKEKSIVLAGCVPQGQQKSDYIQVINGIFNHQCRKKRDGILIRSFGLI